MNKDLIFKATNKGNGQGEILFYADVGFWGITALDFQTKIKEMGNVSKVDLRVISEGGSVIEGIGIYNAIRAHNATWTAHIDGLAASSASWMILPCDKIVMAENAQYMIHRAKSQAFGTAEDLRKTADLISDIEQTAMVRAYQSKTGLDQNTIMDMLNAETWLTADKAKEFGFVDEISETLQMAASVKLSGKYDYIHPPTVLLENSGGASGDVETSDKERPLLQAARLAAVKLKY